jgi:hypothetical protein
MWCSTVGPDCLQPSTILAERNAVGSVKLSDRRERTTTAKVAQLSGYRQDIVRRRARLPAFMMDSDRLPWQRQPHAELPQPQEKSCPP